MLLLVRYRHNDEPVHVSVACARAPAWRARCIQGVLQPIKDLPCPPPPPFVILGRNLGLLLKEKGDLGAAEPLLREDLKLSRETLGDRHPATLTSMDNLGMLRYRRRATSPPPSRCYARRWSYSGAIARDPRRSAPRHATSIGHLGTLLQEKGDLAAAESLLREALQLSRETQGDRHPDTLTSMDNLGMLLQAKGDLAAAELLVREAPWWGRVRPSAVGTHSISSSPTVSACCRWQRATSPALSRSAARRWKGSAPPWANGIRTRLSPPATSASCCVPRATLPPLSRCAARRWGCSVRPWAIGIRARLPPLNNLGRLLKEKGDLAAAEPLSREALQGRREKLGARHPDTLSSISNLGLLLTAKGDLAAAEPLLREALGGRREVLGARHPKTLAAIKNLGALGGSGRPRRRLAAAELNASTRC